MGLQSTLGGITDIEFGYLSGLLDTMIVNPVNGNVLYYQDGFWKNGGVSSIISISGTVNQIDVDNTNPANPVLSISPTLTLPGTLKLGGNIDGNSYDISSIKNYTADSTGTLRTATSDNSTLTLQAYDVDGAVYIDFIRLKSGNVPSCTIVSGTEWNGSPIDLNNYASGTLQAAQFPALTGDITTTAGSLVTTLATVNSNVGTFGSSTQIPSFTVNAKGLITAASNIALSGVAVTSIAGTTNQINASAAVGAVTLSLSSTIVTPGTLAANGTLRTNSSTTCNATGPYNLSIRGTQITDTGGNFPQAGIIIESVFSPSSTSASVTAAITSLPRFNAASARTLALCAAHYSTINSSANIGTITSLASYYSDAFTAVGGTVNRAYGFFGADPGTGTAAQAAYFANLSVGYPTQDLKTTNNAIFVGNVSVGSPTTTALFNVGSSNQFQINASGEVVAGIWKGTAVAEIYGGTNQTTYTTGDLLQATASNTLSKLAAVATGNALISGGIGTASSWGKIGLTTHISGTLGVGNGGTGTSTTFTTGSIIFAGSSGVYTQDNTNFFWDDANNRLGITTNTPSYTLDLTATGVARMQSYRTNAGVSAGALTIHWLLCNTSDAQRWGMGLSGNETGSNAGSDFSLFNYTDVPGFRSTAIKVMRATNFTGIGNITPVNMLDVNGAMAIGSTLAGSVTAPTNGLIVAGKFGAGTGSVDTNAGCQFGYTNNYNVEISSTQTTTNGGYQLALYVAPVMNPTSGASGYVSSVYTTPSFIAPNAQTITNAANIYCYNFVNSNVGTITNAYGLLVDTGSSGAGTITNHYGGYFATPSAGTNKLALYAQNAAVGRTNIIDGVFQVGGNSTKTGGDGVSITCFSSSDATPISLKTGIVGNATATLQGIFLQASESGVSDNRILSLQRYGGNVSVGAATNSYKFEVTGGDIGIMTAGNTLRIKTGTNACMGTGATMIGGAVTVNTTAVATGDIILLSRTAVGGTLGVGMPTITIVNATSFTLTSSNALDTSTYSWWILKAA